MREFFKGWRRKVGCGLLVLACALLGLWMRSWAIQDWLRFPLYGNVHDVVSFNGRIEWWASVPDSNSEWQPFFVSDSVASPTDLASHHRMMIILRDWLKHNQGRGLIFSYWHLALPATLVSAYLILWTPRKKLKDQSNA